MGCEPAVRLGDPQMQILVFVLWHSHPYLAAFLSQRTQILFGFGLLFYPIYFFTLSGLLLTNFSHEELLLLLRVRLTGW